MLFIGANCIAGSDWKNNDRRKQAMPGTCNQVCEVDSLLQRNNE